MKDIQRFIDDARNGYGFVRDASIYELTEDETVLANALLDNTTYYRSRMRKFRKRYHHQLQINKKLWKENWEYHRLFDRIKMMHQTSSLFLEKQETPKTGGKS